MLSSWEKFLTSVLKEESPHEEMFDFIEDSIVYFDSCREGFANFHIAFLAGLSSFLGFEPGQKLNKEDLFFDMQNGIFVPVTSGSWQLCQRGSLRYPG